MRLTITRLQDKSEEEGRVKDVFFYICSQYFDL